MAVRLSALRTRRNLFPRNIIVLRVFIISIIILDEWTAVE
jgi:hypothetical protein